MRPRNEYHDKEIVSMLKKFNRIDLWKKQSLTEQSESCTMLLLWNKYHFEWVKVPCHQKGLDLRSVYCMSGISLIFAHKKGHVVAHSSSKNFVKIRNVFLCSDGSYISVHFVCNNITDCPNGTDENLCDSVCFGFAVSQILKCEWNLKPRKFHVTRNEQYCTQFVDKQSEPKMEALRFPKYSQECKKSQERCMFRKFEKENGYCSHGEHLDCCHNFQCNNNFHCPDYYCVPWRYVCDGVWDCPLGYDEHDCGLHRKPTFFQCTGSYVQVPQQSICDGILDCPNHVDESLCELHSSFCPQNCSCLKHSLFCSNDTDFWKLQEELHTNKNSSVPFIFLKVSFLEKSLGVMKVVEYLNLSVFFAAMNNLSDICLGTTTPVRTIKWLELPFNKIESVRNQCFKSFPNVLKLSLEGNLLTDIPCGLFLKTNKIEMLLLQKNRIHHFQMCFIEHLTVLRHLDLRNNDILSTNMWQNVWPNIQIETTSHILQCPELFGKEITQSSRECGSLLSMAMAGSCWFVGSAGFLINSLIFV